MSVALSNGVSLPWLSEQTGVAVTTILKHYGRFIHSSEADDFEMSKIESRNEPISGKIGHRIGHRDVLQTQNPRFPSGKVASPTGFEPVLPT
jgi:hypothetical protein